MRAAEEHLRARLAQVHAVDNAVLLSGEHDRNAWHPLEHEHHAVTLAEQLAVLRLGARRHVAQP